MDKEITREFNRDEMVYLPMSVEEIAEIIYGGADENEDIAMTEIDYSATELPERFCLENNGSSERNVAIIYNMFRDAGLNEEFSQNLTGLNIEILKIVTTSYFMRKAFEKGGAVEAKAGLSSTARLGLEIDSSNLVREQIEKEARELFEKVLNCHGMEALTLDPEWIRIKYASNVPCSFQKRNHLS